MSETYRKMTLLKSNMSKTHREMIKYTSEINYAKKKRRNDICEIKIMFRVLTLAHSLDMCRA